MDSKADSGDFDGVEWLIDDDGRGCVCCSASMATARNYVLSIQFGFAFGLRHNWCELKVLIDPINAFLQSLQFILFPFPSTIHLRLP